MTQKNGEEKKHLLLLFILHNLPQFPGVFIVVIKL